MSRQLNRVLMLAAIVVGMLASGPARAAQWQTNVNYGATTAMDLYVPDGVGASPAIVVSLHFCGGTAANAHGWFQGFADTNKFIIIAPKSAGSCFDAGLGRSGERANIVKMVQYVVMQKNADPKKVYAAGPSSGACMTQALLASYPDVFAGGSSLAGVPAGAWTGGGAYGWSAPASTTAQQWGDKVRNADPGFTGGRPRVQFWQGMGDTNLTYSQTYPAQVAQWTNVFGVTEASGTKESIKPPGAGKTWARTSWKDCSGLVVVEANSGPSNVVHDLTPEGLWQDAVRFFGLTSGGTVVGSPCGGTSGAAGAGGGSAGGSGGSAGGSGGSAGGATGRGGAQGTAGSGAGTGGGSAGSGAAGSSAGSGGSSVTGSGGSTGIAGSSAAGSGGSTGIAGSSSAGASGTGTGGAIVTGSAGTGSPAGAAGSSATAGSTGGPAGTSGQGTGGSGNDGPPESGDAGGCATAGTGGSSSAVAALFLLATLGWARRRRTRARR